MLKGACLAIAAVVLTSTPTPAVPADAPIKTFSISSRGVVFDLDVDGRVSPILSSDSTASMALGFPMSQMGLKPGEHTLGLTIKKAEKDGFIRITVQESKPGDIVDTSADGKASAPFPIKLAGPQLKPGAKSTYKFTVP
jgi:hypothetical protein